ncbi:SPOR domain-containing protein [Cereibacter sphaeroides]|uniref:SPOR domain-containing protein n=1 Tax=Cereibacter sphaeroides TaxID=1063 RepID=UPI001F2C56F5|nr:SPOR domain-containing protein [Cereibacter sphaeroides]MCE6951796.1 SPOR domain-containing protein [Cereibacter sphaeroides]
MLFRAVSAAMWISVAGAGMAAAQDSAAGPAEPPPSGFAGPQYVDSRGCVFLRAGYGGKVNWVPRVTRDRKPLCGYPPSVPVEAAPEPAEVPPAVPAPTVAAAASSPPAAVVIPTGPGATDAGPAGTATAVPAGPSAVAAVAASAIAKVRPSREAAPAPGKGSPQRRAPIVVQPADATEARVLQHLTLRRDEVRAAGDLPGTVSCPAAAPAPRRFATADGGSTLLCTRPGRGLVGLRVPELSPGDLALLERGPQAAPETGPTARRYVQVGAFLRASNAAGARSRLAALGLPVSVAEGGALEIVLAGPFGDPAATRAALRTARQAGFRDAFIR